MQRLVYVPKLHREELFYSLAARYHRHTMNPAYTATNEEVFGRRSLRATFDLPSHLPYFAGRAPNRPELAPEALALGHTHLPYYTAFLPAAKRQDALSRMVAGHSSLHIWLGLNAFVVPQVAVLRFCPECCRIMDEQEGELWWMRAHQLPGVLVCPEHGCSLRTSGVDMWTRGQHGFSAATRSNCPPDAEPVVEDASPQVMERLRLVAVASAALLTSPGEMESFADLTAYYRRRLFDAGLCKSKNHVDVPRLLDAFSAFWGGALKLLPGVIDPSTGFENWLLELCRTQRKATHPLLHILLRLFLNAQPRHVSIFGAGPWRCPNPEAGHGDRATIVEVKESTQKQGVRQGLFECPCGYAYTMSIDADGGLHGPRFSRFGPLLDPAVTRMVAEGETLRGTAKRLGIHPRAVAAAADRLGLPVRWTPPKRVGRRIGRGVPPARAPRQPRAKTVVPRRPASPRYDWEARDAALAAKVGPAARAVLAKRPLVRVSMRSLETEIDRPNCIYMRKAKLPRTVAAVAAHEESLEAFQMRRIAWAIDELQKAARRVTVSSVMRLAAVKDEWKAYVEEQIALPLSVRRDDLAA